MSRVELLSSGDEQYFHHSVVAIQARKCAHQGDVGTDALPQREVVRFKVPQHLGFPGEALESIIEPTIRNQPYEFHVNLLALTGASGVMPRHFSERVIERSKQKDDALKDFLDIFNHRLISLYHRAWEKYRLPLQFHKKLVSGEADPISQTLYSFVGSPKDTQVMFGGLFSSEVRSVQALKQMLSSISGCEVKIVENIGQWLLLESSEQSKLGCRVNPEGQHAQLGMGAVIGRKTWDVGSIMEISVVADSSEAVLKLMPNSELLEVMQDLATAFLPEHIKSRWTLTAKHRDMPMYKLGQKRIGLGQGCSLAVSERLMQTTTRTQIA
ncbi:type VI secretion system baseplate subunit TssG [Vibrio atypicus]|uniref:type VI secretion system baseplate subunit TssG n=1 Tax=Vibrio atypicus TaxID=558271 RepID=UPI003736D649